MIVTDWTAWLRAVVGADSHQAVSSKLGMSPSTVGRWMRCGRVPAGGALAIARAYGADPVSALLASGHITLRDLQSGALQNAVSIAPTSLLVAELQRRSEV
jgi:DNA-binding transcriptional regulator YdaS (Cro superfamily)